MRGIQHHTVALMGQIEVIHISSAAGQESFVFDAPDRLADAEFFHEFAPKLKRRKL